MENSHDTNEDMLSLSLSIGSAPSSSSYQTLSFSQPLLDPSCECFSSPQQPPPPPPPPPEMYMAVGLNPSQRTLRRPLRNNRARRNQAQILSEGKSETISPPYPWATDRRAIVHTLEYLTSKGIRRITGEVQCKRCEEKFEMEYDLQKEFLEVASFICKNKEDMNQRAPPEWMNPRLPSCKLCDQSNCAKPIISKKRRINWLFLFLGRMVGWCKLSELKYFCKHTKNHRTGAKDRVLFLTYLGLCKQLDPQGPFDID